MNVYTPGLDRIIHSTSADFNKRTLPRPVHVVQYDDGIPILAVTLYLDGNQYTIPENAEMNIRFGKKDGTFVYNPALGCSADRHIVYFEITQQMTVFQGRFSPIAEVVIDGDVAGSGCLDIEIDRNPIQEGDIESSTEFITIQEYASRAETAASAAAISAEEAANTELSADMHRNIFRGKNLGTTITAAQKAAISTGTFDDLYIGDYWVIGEVTYRIADMDYWYNSGDTAFTKHHLVIVPNTSMYNGVMNDTNTTEGGYVGSKMYTEGLTRAKTTIQTAFGELLLTHREYLVNAVTSGYPSAGAWFYSTVELMNEIMVYGSYIYTPGNTGTVTPTRRTINKQQLAIFALKPEMQNNRTYNIWLRDVASSTKFAFTDSSGTASCIDAILPLGVRPAFAIG